MKKIVILSNHHEYTYNFRKEIIEELINQNYKVYLILPYGEKVNDLKRMGCSFINVPLDRRGKNPLTDLKLLINYKKIIKKINPDVVLSYTLKPNLYGAFVCRFLHVPFIANITGLGSAVEKKSILQNAIVKMYQVAFKKVNCIFFQNNEDRQFFKLNNISVDKHKLIPGSGVNLKHFNVLKYPPKETLEFVFISRIMREKGIDHYLEAAEYIKKKYPKTKFHVLGFCEEGYENKLKEMQENKIITYHGMQDDIRKFLENSHCIIHPTYYPEGMSNVLLESAASGRPVITTDRSGCREIVDAFRTGYIVQQKSTEDLIEKIESFLELEYEDKKQMGLLGRKKVENEFDRKIVVKEYMKEVNSVINDSDSV